MIIVADTTIFLSDLKHVHVEDLLLPVLIQLIVIILAARLFAALFRRLGQPSVVGEILAGLILGPSVLKALAPRLWEIVFQPQIGELSPEASKEQLRWIFTTLSQLGLIFLLFLIGLEFDFSHLKWHGKGAFAISAAGVALPFSLGLALAPLLLAQLSGRTEDPPWRADEPSWRLGFSLFLGTTLSITAIPILGRIMMELNITRTKLGTITIASAAFDDALGWILLATVAAIATSLKSGNDSGFSIWLTLRMMGLSIGFALAMIFLIRPAMSWWIRKWRIAQGQELGVNALAILFVVLLLCAIATNLIGIFAIFGAFILGAVLSGEEEFKTAVMQKLRDFVTAFFLPIFFTYTGLQTDAGSLDSPILWLLCGLVTVAAIIGKLLGCGIVAWLSGFPPREAICIGTMMNTRALMALIVINVGYQLGVVPKSVYCMLVLMAVATTIMTTPLLMRFMRGTELEPYIMKSSFVRGKTTPT